MKIDFRLATTDDAPRLAAMNARLIHDEGHRNQMSLKELQDRQRQWLSTDYQAVLFAADDVPVGYARSERVGMGLPPTVLCGARKSSKRNRARRDGMAH